MMTVTHKSDMDLAYLNFGRSMPRRGNYYINEWWFLEKVLCIIFYGKEKLTFKDLFKIF